jgi:ComF family protein
MTESPATPYPGWIKRLLQRAANLSGQALDLVLPPRCPATGEVVDRPGMLAPAFWRDLTFINAPFCACCGMPFPLDLDAGAGDILCGACLAHPFDFDRARAAVVYNDASRRLILGFKYGDRLHAITTFTPWLMRAGSALIRESDVIVPVPLHRRRLWQRRFNQSALLARGLSGATGKPALYHALRRLHHTPPQKGLTRHQRQKNVATAFGIAPACKNKIAGRRVLLIDDVFTSGATLNACARALRDAGATHVAVLTLARVTREDFN